MDLSISVQGKDRPGNHTAKAKVKQRTEPRKTAGMVLQNREHQPLCMFRYKRKNAKANKKLRRIFNRAGVGARASQNWGRGPGGRLQSVIMKSGAEGCSRVQKWSNFSTESQTNYDFSRPPCSRFSATWGPGPPGHHGRGLKCPAKGGGGSGQSGILGKTQRTTKRWTADPHWRSTGCWWEVHNPQTARVATVIWKRLPFFRRKQRGACLTPKCNVCH